MSQVISPPITVGTEIPPVRHQPDEIELFRFSAALWLPHRIHYDRDYAHSEGHRDILTHGPLQGTYLGQMVANWAAPLGGRLARLKYQHRNPAFVNEALVCTGRVTEVASEGEQQRVTCEVWIEKAETGERTTIGTAEVVIPGRPQA